MVGCFTYHGDMVCSIKTFLMEGTHAKDKGSEALRNIDEYLNSHVEVFSCRDSVQRSKDPDSAQESS